MATNYILSGEESVKQILKKGNNKLYGIDKSVITNIQSRLDTLENGTSQKIISPYIDIKKYFSDKYTYTDNFYYELSSRLLGKSFKSKTQWYSQPSDLQPNIMQGTEAYFTVNNNIKEIQYRPAQYKSQDTNKCYVYAGDSLTPIEGNIKFRNYLEGKYTNTHDMVTLNFDNAILKSINFDSFEVEYSFIHNNINYVYTISTLQSFSNYTYPNGTTRPYYFYNVSSRYKKQTTENGITTTEILENDNALPFNIIPCGYYLSATGASTNKTLITEIVCFFRFDITLDHFNIIQSPNNLFEQPNKLSLWTGTYTSIINFLRRVISYNPYYVEYTPYYYE